MEIFLWSIARKEAETFPAFTGVKIPFYKTPSNPQGMLPVFLGPEVSRGRSDQKQPQAVVSRQKEEEKTAALGSRSHDIEASSLGKAPAPHPAPNESIFRLFALDWEESLPRVSTLC